MVSLIVTLVLIGVGLYFLNTYVPMAAPIKTLINVLVVLLVFLWVLNIFGLISYPLPVNRLR